MAKKNEQSEALEYEGVRIRKRKVQDYKQLKGNPNAGTLAGSSILEQSVREVGAARSLVADNDDNLDAGNHTQEALINAGIHDVIEVETDGHTAVVVKRRDVDPDSVLSKKIALYDNRSSEVGLQWERDNTTAMLLAIEEAEGENNMYFQALGEEVSLDPETIYTRKVTAPIYEPTGEMPMIHELFDDSKTQTLIAAILASDLDEAEKEFLTVAARRHTRINFKKVAEYYCHASAEVQELMEQSALVILDFEKAIELGYVRLADEVAALYRGEYDEQA